MYYANRGIFAFVVLKTYQEPFKWTNTRIAKYSILMQNLTS